MDHGYENDGYENVEGPSSSTPSDGPKVYALDFADDHGRRLELFPELLMALKWRSHSSPEAVVHDVGDPAEIADYDALLAAGRVRSRA